MQGFPTSSWVCISTAVIYEAPISICVETDGQLQPQKESGRPDFTAANGGTEATYVANCLGT